MKKVNLITKNCKQCDKSFKFKSYFKRTYCGRGCQMKATLYRGRGKFRDYSSITNENNYAWRGGNVSYFGLHAWIQRKLGTPSRCEFCETTTAKKYEWANKSKQYKRDLNDWVRLCKSCHVNFDDVANKGWQTRRQHFT